jgi:putative solute:sodium symporter small subunit
LKNTPSQSYWQSNIRILVVLLAVWFVASFGFGILWSDTLDEIKIGGFKLGFWFAQQGSIYIFVLLIFIYVFLMNRLDKKYRKDMSVESEEQ